MEELGPRLVLSLLRLLREVRALPAAEPKAPRSVVGEVHLAEVVPLGAVMEADRQRMANGAVDAHDVGGVPR
ncbi:MAG: hypothetical protein GY772_00815, partial [bacterium]|nr:hypothetical protein [bacterium]